MASAQPADGAIAGRVEAGGARVAYRRDGTGPGLVLVHGTGGDSRSNWDGLVPHLGDRWTVVRPDYAGSGETEDDGGPLSLDALAEQVVGAARHAGVAPFHLVGFSLGAGIAAAIAARHGDLVRSLVLINGFASAEDARLRLQFETWRDLVARDRRTMARLVLLTGLLPDTVSGLGTDGVEAAVEATLAETRWEGLARQVALDLRLDVRDRLGDIRAPALVIGAAHDHMVPPAHARALGAAISGARYVELPVGHLAVMDAPEAVAGPLLAFLDDQPD